MQAQAEAQALARSRRKTAAAAAKKPDPEVQLGSLPLPKIKEKEKRDCQCVASAKADKMYGTHQPWWDELATWYNQALDPSFTAPLDPDQQHLKDLVGSLEPRGASESAAAAKAEHRFKSETNQLWNAMVTKTFNAGDPITRSPLAKAALDKEFFSKGRDIMLEICEYVSN